MNSKEMTAHLVKRYRQESQSANDALAEVLCYAYKDATGAYPNDRIREAIHLAVEQ